MHSIFTALLLLSLLSASLANDPQWPPCFEGVCTSETSGYSMTIQGPKEAISDISEAADWLVLDCDPKATKQEIRIVCRGPEASLGCKHLYENGEPVNKVVRLPAHCSKDAFARISKFWVHENQAIPSKIALRAADTAPKVHGLAFDTDFAAIPNLSNPIKFAFASVTQAIPSLKWLGGSTDWFAKEASQIEEALEAYEKFDKHYDFVVPIKNQTMDYSLLEPGFTCALGKESVSGDFRATASAEVDLSFAAGINVKGTLSPPNVTFFRMYGKLRGHVSGSIKLGGKVTGSMDTNDVVLLDIPLVIPGVPNLLEVGPKFELAVRLKGNLDLDFEQEIGFKYKMDNIRLFFPQTAVNQNDGSITASDSPLSLRLGNTESSSMDVSVHVMPRIAIGITVPGGRADMFADFDFSGTSSLNFEKTPDPSHTDKRAARFAAVSHHSEDRTNLAVSEASGNQLMSRGFTDSLVKAGLHGCAYVAFDVGAHTGCSASFFGLFNSNSADHEIQLFKPLSFELLKTCTSDQKAKEHKPTEPEPLRISDDFADKGHPEGLKSAGFAPRSILEGTSLVGRNLVCSSSFQSSDLAVVYDGLAHAEKIE